MSDPDKYSVGYSFSGFQAINPEEPLPGPDLDAELAKLAVFSDEVVEALKNLRRADGSLQNGTVTWDGLNADVKARINGSAEGATVGDISPTAFATQNEAEVGAANDRLMTPLGTKYALDAQRPFSSQGEAEAGTATDSVMSPLRTAEAIDAQRPYSTEAEAQAGIDSESVLSPLMAGALIRSLRRANIAEVDLTWGEIAAGESSAQTVTVAGAQTGDRVVIGLPAAGIDDGLVVQAWVSSENNVRIRVLNTTGDAVTPHSGAATTYQVTAMGFTASDDGDTEVAAQTWATLAQQWAEEDEDSEVTTGQYSAKHWAAKAAASAALVEIRDFTSLADLRTAVDEFDGDDGERLVIPGGALIADSGQASWSASPAIAGFRPENGILTTEMFGSTSELVSDGKGRLEQAIDDCCANDWKLKLNPIIDGSPYEWNYIDHDISGRLHLIFDPRAEFYRTTAFQVFDTDGTTGPFVIDAWDYQGAATEGISVMHVDSSGNETILAVTSGYTEALNGSNYEITTVATYPIGGYIVAASTKQNLGLNGTSGAGDTVIIEGQAKFNMARCGYVLASASGTAFNCTQVDNIEVPGLVHGYGTAASGPDAAPQLRRGDTVFTANQYKHLSITGELRGDYINDLIFYGTGGGSAGDTDNPERAFINYISGLNPRNGFKFVRQTRGAHVNYVNLVDPWAGFAHGITSGLSTGSMISIGSMALRRVRRRGVDIGETDGSIFIGNLVIEDFGRAAGGGDVQSDAAAVFLSDAHGVTINNLDVRMRDWTAPTNRPAVQLGGSDNWGNRINGGWIKGLDVGISETGSQTNDFGNDFNMTMVNVANELSLHPDSRATYDITTITESSGTISATGRLHRKAFKETFTPNLYFAGESAPSHSNEDGTYLFDGANTLQFSIDSQVNGWTHSDTGILRLSMPSGFVGGALGGEPQVFTVSTYFGLDVDAQATSPGDLVALMPDGASYLQFRFSETDGASGDFLNQSAVTSGATVRVVVSGVAFVNQV